MKKQDLIQIYGSVKSVADAFGISRQAVYRWPDELPELRQYQLRDKLKNISTPKSGLPHA